MKPITILTVDDDPEIRKLVRITLDNGKRNFVEAETALDGFHKVQETRPDILLLDIGLPGTFDGFSLCEALEKDLRLNDLNIIVVTGHDDHADIERARRHHAYAYLVKPFAPSKLRELVECVEQHPRMEIVRNRGDIACA